MAYELKVAEQTVERKNNAKSVKCRDCIHFAKCPDDRQGFDLDARKPSVLLIR